MSTIAIVYHSGFGHTETIANAVAEGVSQAGATAKLVKIENAAEDFADKMASLNEVDGIIFGAPTYMGSLSAPFKAFMDASSRAWLNKDWQDKVAAGFTNSGSMSGDKLNSLVQLAVFAAQHAMIWVGSDQLPNSGYQKPTGAPDAINRLGSTLGVMAQSEQADPSETPPPGDKETATLLGKRVAEITEQLLKGRAA